MNMTTLKVMDYTTEKVIPLILRTYFVASILKIRGIDSPIKGPHYAE